MTDLERYLNAVAAMFEPVAILAEESGDDGSDGYVPPYGTLFNPLTVPKDGMRYLAQYVGVPLPEGGTETEWRERLLAESGLERGTPQSLKRVIERVTGETISAGRILERTAADGLEEPYHFVVICKTGQATQALYNAIDEVKPAGLWYTLLEVTGAWIEGTKKWSEVTAGKKFSNIVEGEY